MLKFVVLLLVSALDCGLEAAAVPDGRIVGGQPTTIDKYPYIVSVQKLEYHICGGSILGPRFVLTASHCVYNVSTIGLTIRAGSTYHNFGGQVVQVNKVIVHQQYKKTPSEDYDIAVLRLQKSLIVGAITILPSHSYKDGDLAYVAGWGVMSSGGIPPFQLMAADVKIITEKSCNRYYPRKITFRMICAASPGKDSCQGDSGGPLVVDGVQVGVVSWGYGCADPGHPGVYTDVFALKRWIQNQIKT